MVKLKELCAIVLVIVLAFSVHPQQCFAAKKSKNYETKQQFILAKQLN